MKTTQMLDFALLAAQHVLRPAPPPPPAVPVPTAPVRVLDGKREMLHEAAFFAGVRKITGPLDQVQVDTIKRILAGAAGWPASWLAYALATAWHECRLRPIAEIGKGKGRKYGVPGKWYGQVPYGRGLPQATWDFNYEWLDAALGLGGSLLRNFDRMLEPDISARALIIGMETGNYTGKALKHYLKQEFGTRSEFVSSRRIINGTDKADKIAGYAVGFQDLAIRPGRWED